MSEASVPGEMSGLVALAPGRRARVTVPATSANLGPGFDAMGLAVELRDELWAEVLDEGLDFELSGEGAQTVPRDESHLVVTVLRRALADLGFQAPGLRLGAHNVIPHGRGLGSSAAAIVGAIALAWGLARPDEPLDRDWACRLSSEVEGHPDNACAAVLGGVILAWETSAGTVGVAELEAVDGLSVIAWVPAFEVATSGARAVLPEQLSRPDAIRQATASALLVHALTVDPSCLLDATRDWLHQSYRAELMQPSAGLIAALREQGVAAVVSGAGPTVLALGTPTQLAAARELAHEGFVRHELGIGPGVELLA